MPIVGFELQPSESSLQLVPWCLFVTCVGIEDRNLSQPRAQFNRPKLPVRHMQYLRPILAEEAEVQLAYAIGFSQPVSVRVNTKGTGKLPDAQLTLLVKDIFDYPHQALLTLLI